MYEPIDFSPLIGSPEEELKIAESLKQAFSKHGFAYIKGHGVPKDLMRNLFNDSKAFFENHSANEKAASCPLNLDTGHGYEIKSESECIGLDNKVREIKEALNVVTLDDKSPFPDKLYPELRHNVVKMADETLQLIKRILRLLAVALGKHPDFFVPHHEKIFQGTENKASRFRFAYYPAIEQGYNVGHNTRCGIHTDYGTISLIFENDPELEGLELKTNDGEWIKSAPKDDSFLVIAGDMLEIWSNGLFPATIHKVVIPQDADKANKDRHSFIFFVQPDENCLVEPLIENESSGKSYKKITSGDHIKNMFAKHHIT